MTIGHKGQIKRPSLTGKGERERGDQWEGSSGPTEQMGIHTGVLLQREAKKQTTEG